MGLEEKNVKKSENAGNGKRNNILKLEKFRLVLNAVKDWYNGLLFYILFVEIGSLLR